MHPTHTQTHTHMFAREIEWNGEGIKMRWEFIVFKASNAINFEIKQR